MTNSKSGPPELPNCEDPNVILVRNLALDRIGPGPFEPVTGWRHVGAVITDAVLQAGMRYTTVKQRVDGLVKQWPDASTLAGFRRRIQSEGLSEVLDWSGKKLDTIAALTDRLSSEVVDGRSLDTVADLRIWLTDPENPPSLRTIKGIGAKTENYLCSVSGLSAVAIDVHLRSFAAEAGVRERSYLELRRLYEATAHCMGVDAGALDHAVWEYCSTR
jgi:hypothetical protein